MKTTTTTKGNTMKNQKRAEICLYGNREIGFGWLLAVHGLGVNGLVGRAGSVKPVATQSLTDCIFAAAADLSDARHGDALVAVYAPGGESVAIVDLANEHMPNYGTLSTRMNSAV